VKNNVKITVAKKTNIRNQGKQAFKVKEESQAEVGKEAKQNEHNSAEQNKLLFAAEGNVVAKPVEDGEEIIELV